MVSALIFFFVNIIKSDMAKSKQANKKKMVPKKASKKAAPKRNTVKKPKSVKKHQKKGKSTRRRKLRGGTTGAEQDEELQAARQFKMDVLLNLPTIEEFNRKINEDTQLPKKLKDLTRMDYLLNKLSSEEFIEEINEGGYDEDFLKQLKDKTNEKYEKIFPLWYENFNQVDTQIRNLRDEYINYHNTANRYPNSEAVDTNLKRYGEEISNIQRQFNENELNQVKNDLESKSTFLGKKVPEKGVFSDFVGFIERRKQEEENKKQREYEEHLETRPSILRTTQKGTDTIGKGKQLTKGVKNISKDYHQYFDTKRNKVGAIKEERKLNRLIKQAKAAEEAARLLAQQNKYFQERRAYERATRPSFRDPIFYSNAT